MDLLKKDKHKLKGKKIHFSSATDAYQPEEANFRLTRACLEIMSDNNCELSILTKSALVVRDIGIINCFNNPTVGFSFSCHDDRVMRMFENSTSTINERVEALKKLRDSGIKTWVFISPLLPFISAYEAIVELVAPYVDSISASSYNPYHSTYERMSCSYKLLGINFDKVLKATLDPGYWDTVERNLQSACSKKGVAFKGLYRHKNNKDK